MNLSSSNTAVATVPATVTVAAVTNTGPVPVTGVAAGSGNPSCQRPRRVRTIDLRYLERWGRRRRKTPLRQMGVDQIYRAGRTISFFIVY